MLIVEAKSPPLQVDRNGVMRIGGTRVTLDTVENFDNRILRGLLRRQPDLDIIRIQDTEVAETDDPVIDDLPIGAVIEDLLTIARCSLAPEWINQVQRLPL